jgi:hypothetical protein
MERWLEIEAVILSGQVPDADIDKMMQSDPAFAAWLKARAADRQAR